MEITTTQISKINLLYNSITLILTEELFLKKTRIASKIKIPLNANKNIMSREHFWTGGGYIYKI